MSTLTERVQAANVHPRAICNVKKAKLLLPDLAGELDALIADQTIMSVTIAREFTALAHELRPGRTFELNESSVRRHRRGDCTC